ncbi:MAG: hypothetical protein JO061_20295 [Acidobacteriaceae bacterium]|nr:hypothetical protein [Acidobacteriaceae bacterium]
MPVVKTICMFGTVALLLSCGSPPKSDIPALNPEEAASLLQFDNKAADWLKYVKKQNPACDYKLDLPDQSAHPTEIDLDHIVWCSSRPGPREYDASVVFVYDKATQRWTVSRFSS